MRLMLKIGLLAVLIAVPLLMPRLVRSFIRPPAPPLPGIAIPLPATKPPGAITPMPATERIEAVRKRYLGAKTYRDIGRQTIAYSTGPARESTATFTTAFERNGRELWAYRESEEGATAHSWLYVVTSDDQRTFRSWWTIDPSPKIADSHQMAYAGPTGISRGNAVMILPLLRGGSSHTSVSDAEPVDNGVEVIDGVQCAVLALKPGEGTVVTLWIDADHAIRRIKEVSRIDSTSVRKLDASIKEFDSFTATTITDFTPVFDQPLPDVVFEFDPAKLPK